MSSTGLNVGVARAMVHAFNCATAAHDHDTFISLSSYGLGLLMRGESPLRDMVHIKYNM